MKIKIIPILFWLFYCSFHLQAQEQTARKTELGLNITNTLSGFLNSGGQSAPLDPYLLSIKRISNNQGIRLGLNFRVQNSDEFDDFAGGFQRNTKDISTNIRIGYEKRIPLSKRFTMFWGVDAVGQYKKEEVTFFSFNGNIDLNEIVSGFGGGPVVGIMCYLHPRVYLSTESYIYGVYKIGNETEILDPNNPVPTETKIRELDIIPVYPNALYLTFLF